jgi:hypothetical protein
MYTASYLDSILIVILLDGYIIIVIPFLFEKTKNFK